MISLVRRVEMAANISAHGVVTSIGAGIVEFMDPKKLITITITRKELSDILDEGIATFTSPFVLRDIHKKLLIDKSLT